MDRNRSETDLQYYCVLLDWMVLSPLGSSNNMQEATVFKFELFTIFTIFTMFTNVTKPPIEALRVSNSLITVFLSPF